MRKIEFDCELKEKQWTGTAEIKELDEKMCLAEVNARDTVFIIALTCYCEVYGMKEWCVCVPNWNFGCQISEISAEWNEEQFSKYVKNKVDRRSLVCAIKALLEECKKSKVAPVQQEGE